jgi:hypothetical protein
MRVTYSGPALITASTEISERGRLRHYGALRSDNVIGVEREGVPRMGVVAFGEAEARETVNPRLVR